MSKKDSQESSIFSPSKPQLKYLEAFISSESGKVTDIAKDSGVPRRTIYNWRQDSEFVQWFNKQVSEWMKADLPVIWQDIKRRAKRNHNDSKLYLERFDKDYSEKKNINLEGNINAQGEVLVSVVNITEDEKEVKK